MADRLLSSITRLNGENYHDWKFAIGMAMRARGCWDVVSGKEKRPTDGKEEKEWDRKAEEGLTLIGLSMQPSQYTYIRDAKNGVDAWTALKDAYEKNSRSTRINLKRQFYNFEHDINAPIQVYISGITDLAGKLKAIRVALTDEDITDVLIFNLDNEYSSIASTLMASKSEFKVADVTSALLEEEQRKGGAPPPSVDTIALMGKSSDHPHFGTGPPGRRGPYRDARDGIKRACYRCGRTGHTFKFCRAGRDINGKPIPDDEESKEDEKSSLAYLATIDESLNHWSY